MATPRKKHAGGRPTKYKEEYCEMLIEHMESGLSFETFGAIVDVHKEALYEWVKKHKEFANAKATATLRCQLFWEKIGRSGTVGKIAGFNTSAWIFNMKNRFNWTDNRNIVHSGEGNQPIRIVIDDDDQKL